MPSISSTRTPTRLVPIPSRTFLRGRSFRVKKSSSALARAGMLRTSPPMTTPGSSCFAGDAQKARAAVVHDVSSRELGCTDLQPDELDLAALLLAVGLVRRGSGGDLLRLALRLEVGELDFFFEVHRSPSLPPPDASRCPPGRRRRRRTVRLRWGERRSRRSRRARGCRRADPAATSGRTRSRR